MSHNSLSEQTISEIEVRKYTLKFASLLVKKIKRSTLKTLKKNFLEVENSQMKKVKALNT